MFLQVIHEVVESLMVGVHAFFLGIGDENDAVNATQDQLAAGVIEYLPGNSVKMDAGLESAHGAKIQGQEVKKQGTIGLRRQRDHLAFLLLRSFLVNVLEIGGLAAQASAVVDDLAIDFPGREIDETQRLSSNFAADARCCDISAANFGLVLLGLYHTVKSYCRLPQLLEAIRSSVWGECGIEAWIWGARRYNAALFYRTGDAMRFSVFIGTIVDGFIARPNGDLDFLPADGGEPHGYEEFMADIDTLLIGRKTYETVLAYPDWPYGKRRVVVLSSRKLDFSGVRGGTVEQMSGSPAEIAQKLEASGARNVYVDGGVTIQGFLRAGLIQRLIITRVPVLIGEGIPLFGSLPQDVRLRQVETRHYAGGLVKTEYRVVD